MPQTTLSDYKNNLFSNHFLEERIQEMDEWEETEVEEQYERLQEEYNQSKRYLDNNPNESRTWKKIIRPLVKILGHHPEPEPEHESGLNPDYTLFRDGNEFLDAKDDEAEFERAYGILEIKRWGRKFDKSSKEGDKDDNSNPAYQTYNYVDRLRVPWGILTDGRKWRLYSYEKCGKKIFFEIDLIDSVILEQDEEKAKRNFKLFYLLFRQQAFSPKGKGFADEVLEGTLKYNKKLKENLKKDVYSAVEEACKGFFEFTEQEATKENRELVHDSALTFMYRLLFVMNAESRGLLPIENQTYHEEYSVQWFQEKIVEKEEIPEFKYNTLGWDRLEKLFKGINSGEPLDRETEIPPYNGGMFEHPDENEEVDPENKFLAENSIPGPFLKEIIKRLGTTKEDGELKTVDYRDLDIRHLGSIYEGLLENELQPPAENNLVLKDGEWQEASQEEFDKADEENRVEEGEVYLANDSGERKETGSYYTPDYIVEYIVENTIGPKVEETLEDFQEGDTEQDKLRKILDLNVCDPAMGSGHFLTEATNYIADAVIENIQMEELDIEEEDETNWAKRQVVQNCIYGVDINPLATELAKVSLWIETMAEGKPLNFLDHHLKVGNSLIGSEFNEIFIYPFNDEQKTLQQIDEDKFRFGSPTEQIKKFKQEYKRIEEMDEKTVDDIHEKEEEYQKFKEDLLYRHFKQVANVHTHQYFENDMSQAEYESELLQAVGVPGTSVETEDWFKRAQKDAENRNYFHWQLEFPKVFFGEQNGFDAVVGNPPYVASAGRSDISANIQDSVRPYLRENYEVAKDQFDLYTIFSERAIKMTDFGGRMSYIVPDSLLSREQISVMRKYLLENTEIDKLLWAKQVFEGVESGNSIFVVSKSGDINKDHQISCFLRKDDELEGERNEISQGYFLQNDNYRFDLKLSDAKIEVIRKVESVDAEFETFADVKRGEEIGKRSEKISGEGEPIISGTAIQRYSVDPENYLFIDPDEVEKEERYYQEEKLVYRQTGGEIRGAFDEEGVYSIKSVYNCITERPFNLMGVTNSSLIEFYHDLTEGGYRDVFPQLNQSTLEALPVPENSSEKLREKTKEAYESKEAFLEEKNNFLEWVEAEWGVDVDNLSLKTHLREYWEYDFDEFMRVAKKNKSQIDGNVKSREFRELMKEEWESSMDTLRPLMQEIYELENEIDAFVFDLYDLTVEEVVTVLDTIEMRNEKRRNILEKFQSI